jgi:hypothetical protein
MTALAVNQFANLKELTRAVMQESPFKVLKREGGVPDNLFEILLTAPAMVADWILQHAKHLAERPELRIGMVCPGSRGVEVIDDGRWYSTLPELLGNPRLKTHVSLIRGTEPDSVRTPLSALKLPFRDAKTYELPLHTYLENCPDGKLDLLVLVDADTLVADAPSWAGPLADLLASDTPVVAIAASADEYVLIEGLLGLFGFHTKGAPYKNRFSTAKLGPFALMDNLNWGSYLWEIQAPETKGTMPGENLKEEALHAVRFVRSYSNRYGAYPPLTQIGSTVEGADSPAKDGRRLVVLPENLYFDPVNEKLGVKVEGELVSRKGLDDYAAKSAVVAAYEGRSSRFMQFLWAVHVFEDCLRLMPALSDISGKSGHTHDRDNSEDEAEREVCPNCGEVHTAEDRVDGVRHLLGHLLDDEAPAVRLKAALQVALDAVDAGGLNLNHPEESVNQDERSAEELDDLEIYETLLNRGYLRAAFGMWQEDPDLDEMGVDEDGWPLAMLAILEGEFAVLDQMLDSGVQFECQSEDGMTVFHALAMLDSGLCEELPEDLAGRLCLAGANPNTPDEDGERPLETAAYAENWSVFLMLIRCGAETGGTRLDIDAVLAQMRRDGGDAMADILEAATAKTAGRSSRKKNGDPGKGSPTKRK